MNCACMSGKEFSQCCEPVIGGEQKAKTAEQLMRARYTAFTIPNMDFIFSTLDPKTQCDFDKDANRKWAESSEWLGLQVIKTEAGQPEDKEGRVEFIAKFDQGEGVSEHHELASFRKINNEWFFTDAQNPNSQTFVHEKPKVGRNELCICGSGKKYKKCCGAH